MPKSMSDFLAKIASAGKPAPVAQPTGNPDLPKTEDGYYIGYAGLKPLDGDESEKKAEPSPQDAEFYQDAYAGLRDVDEMSEHLHGKDDTDQK
jgi:hypothetical protein